jgi:hypothetical protein
MLCGLFGFRNKSGLTLPWESDWQVRQFLAPQASCGNQDAIDLLELLDEEFQER